MYDNDPEIILLVPGIIVAPSLQEKYVNHSKENIHDQTGNLYKTIFYVKVQRLPPCLRALAIIPISPQRRVVYDRSPGNQKLGQQEKLSPDQNGGDDIEAAARWKPLSQQLGQTLQLK